MADELIDICNESNNLTGIQKMKSEAHQSGLWHRASHIWIYNSKGELLLQLRAKDKLLYPDMWDISVGGHVGAGEETVAAGLREMEEEIGLKVGETKLEFIEIRKTNAIYRDVKNNEFYYVYLLRFDDDIKKLKPQNEEIQKIKFLSIDKIKQELESNLNAYVPHGSYWHDVLGEIQKRLNK